MPAPQTRGSTERLSDPSDPSDPSGPSRAEPALALLVVAFLLLTPFDLLLPAGEEPLLGSLPQIDKWVHGALFAGLAIVLYRALAGGALRRVSWSAFLASTTYGALLEVLQSVIPGRHSSWMDAAANAVGAALGALVARRWMRLR